MYWLFVAKGMAQGTFIGGVLGAAALAFNGHDLVWAPLVAALIAALMLKLIDREMAR